MSNLISNDEFESLDVSEIFESDLITTDLILSDFLESNLIKPDPVKSDITIPKISESGGTIKHGTSESGGITIPKISESNTLKLEQIETPKYINFHHVMPRLINFNNSDQIKKDQLNHIEFDIVEIGIFIRDNPPLDYIIGTNGILKIKYETRKNSDLNVKILHWEGVSYCHGRYLRKIINAINENLDDITFIIIDNRSFSLVTNQNIIYQSENLTDPENNIWTRYRITIDIKKSVELSRKQFVSQFNSFLSC